MNLEPLSSTMIAWLLSLWNIIANHSLLYRHGAHWWRKYVGVPRLIWGESVPESYQSEFLFNYIARIWTSRYPWSVVSHFTCMMHFACNRFHMLVLTNSLSFALSSCEWKLDVSKWFLPSAIPNHQKWEGQPQDKRCSTAWPKQWKRGLFELVLNFPISLILTIRQLHI